MTQIHDIESYSIEANDSFFLDANVWIYIFYSMGNHREEFTQKFSAFYEKIRENGNKVYINSLLLSELVNRLERLEYSRLTGDTRGSNFKWKFRDNPDYKSDLDSIRELISKKIVSNTISCCDKFETFDFKANYLEADNIDFNDAIHIKSAKSLDLKIVTNDKDFKNIDEEIEIITIL